MNAANAFALARAPANWSCSHCTREATITKVVLTLWTRRESVEGTSVARFSRSRTKPRPSRSSPPVPAA